VIRNLDAMMREIDLAGAAAAFHLYVLSDTSQSDIASLEEAGFDALAAQWRGRVPVIYRRRTVNTGFKAGNFWDFCQRWGSQHEFAVTLDTDSFMTAAAIMRMVRVIQADPKLGILQGLVVGLPSTAPSRASSSSACGSACVHGPSARLVAGRLRPILGHNAIIRIAPFIAHCHIPKLPEGGVLGGHVLSHDQIEAALMRRAGYDVRVLPEEDLGWEENPPTLIEFIRRDQRWCQGTLQYGHFLFRPGLKFRQPLSARLRHADVPGSPPGSGSWWSARWRSPPLHRRRFHPAGRRPCAARRHPRHVVCAEDRDRDRCPDQAETPPCLRRHARFLVSVATETVFFILLSPIMWICHTLFLAGCRSAASSAGSARCATTTLFRGRSRCISCGRTPRLDLPPSASSPPPSRRRSATLSCSPAARRCRFRSRCSPRGPRLVRCSPASASAACPRRRRRRWR